MVKQAICWLVAEGRLWRLVLPETHWLGRFGSPRKRSTLWRVWWFYGYGGLFQIHWWALGNGAHAKTTLRRVWWQ